ncbi:MAG: hypothetical protein M1827_007308 [Pycnora praestabilis]|nr:MAG: hypothetical protein M1827_007308 [Pycnora praestabilis]
MAANGTSTSQDEPKKLKILMLHGYTQSGPLFHAKTRALEKALQKAIPAAPSSASLPQYPGGVQLIYPTAPMKLRMADIPGREVGDEDTDEPDAWGWWRKNTGTGEYIGIDSGLKTIAETLKDDGPFVGVIGFSQGGCAAGMVTSLLEPGRRQAFDKAREEGGMEYPTVLLTDGDVIHPQLKFGVSYSGFGAPHELYHAFYEPKITTPTLHFIGSLDSVVEESRSQRLIDACVGKKDETVIYHPGGHFLPSQKQFVNALVGFIRNAVQEHAKQGTQQDGEHLQIAHEGT